MAARALWCALTLLVCGGVCSGQELQLPSRVDGSTRGNVVFKPSRLPSDSYNVIIWSFTTPIITVAGNTIVTSSAYRDRTSLNLSTLALELRNLTANDSGVYSLSFTGNTDYKAETTLHVFENISGVNLIRPSEPIIEGNSTSLTCEASGMVVSTEWTKDNHMLSPSSSIIFSSDNRSVTINPVKRQDRGEYRCTLSNPVSSGSSLPYTMIVNYGPDSVQVTGPSEVEEEMNVELLCKTDSVPEPFYEWQFNGTKTEVTTATFSVYQVNFTHSGNYICIAWNNVTRHNASGSHMLAVKEKRTLSGDGGPLSPGAIAGIVIGVLLGVAGVAGLIVYFLKVKGRPNSSSEGATKNGGDSGGFYENTKDLQGNPPPPPGGTNKEEPNYENVRRLPSIPLAYRGMRPNQRY